MRWYNRGKTEIERGIASLSAPTSADDTRSRVSGFMMTLANQRMNNRAQALTELRQYLVDVKKDNKKKETQYSQPSAVSNLSRLENELNWNQSILNKLRLCQTSSATDILAQAADKEIIRVEQIINELNMLKSRKQTGERLPAHDSRAPYKARDRKLPKGFGGGILPSVR